MAEETTSVITKRPIYDQIGRMPKPVGTLLKVSPALAAFWIKRGIARAAEPGEKGNPDTLSLATMRPAPDMTAPPATPS
ncbi:hypothetical protein K2X14_07715 [Acetobacter sp. TBRC 12305]|uniref:Uncharacterized protein n=1 Tax=Acetobacter garciniae TaxID=2817435 RepID=A0A939HPZ3_9PROT|nr:hypothetical protein [Acetobacter garciniae]MBO1325309.1 hypothetical protein [Acetobacter garciniae]MBX0344719.1 hypothetical protein [Acetobacter garciniae]